MFSDGLRRSNESSDCRYGMGNLHSVLKSVQAAQVLSDKYAEVYLTSRPEEVMAADKVIFPGQGAMPDCMSALKASGLGEAVSDGLKNKPFLEFA